ncbi:hypothetical protein GCM10009069_26770 [Algimonas arctica]|uniref:Uncharacterized protein n=1 Tax=Algimonas arctica TaxID=1479486 RepID=A0A8J3CTX4_9PROT|nr:hypothetical protein GCM10009069_26770 [Algimonas arctica]
MKTAHLSRNRLLRGIAEETASFCSKQAWVIIARQSALSLEANSHIHSPEWTLELAPKMGHSWMSAAFKQPVLCLDVIGNSGEVAYGPDLTRIKRFAMVHLLHKFEKV